MHDDAGGVGGGDALLALFADVRTERLALRRLRAEDAAALFAIDGDPATHQYDPAAPDADLAASERRLREWMQAWQVDGVGYWAVTLPETTAQTAETEQTAEVIGFGGVRRLTWRERETLNLYYRFAPSAWGQGYASEMARTAVSLARAHLPQCPVIARIRPANVPSRRVAERAGLAWRPDLDDSDHMIYALGWSDT